MSTFSFDFEKSPELQQKIQTDLEGILEISTGLDKAVSEDMNIPTGALFSKNRGLKMWDNWLDGAAPYKDLYGKMKDLNVRFGKAHNAYAEAEEESALSFGAELDKTVSEIEESAFAKELSEVTIDSLRQEALLKSGFTDMDGVPFLQVRPGGDTHISINGVDYLVSFNDDGSMRELWAKPNGALKYGRVDIYKETSIEDSIAAMLNGVSSDDDFEVALLRIKAQYGTEGEIVAKNIFGTAGQFGIGIASVAAGAANVIIHRAEDQLIEIHQLDDSLQHTNQEYKDAGRGILNSAENVLSMLIAERSEAAEITLNVASGFLNSEKFVNMNPREQLAMLDDLKKLEGYDAVVKSLEAECDHSWRANDGAFGDFDSVLVGGLTGNPQAAYEKAVETANVINEQINSLPMTVDGFKAKYGEIYEDIVNSQQRGGLVSV